MFLIFLMTLIHTSLTFVRGPRASISSGLVVVLVSSCGVDLTAAVRRSLAGPDRDSAVMLGGCGRHRPAAGAPGGASAQVGVLPAGSSPSSSSLLPLNVSSAVVLQLQQTAFALRPRCSLPRLLPPKSSRPHRLRPHLATGMCNLTTHILRPHLPSPCLHQDPFPI